MHAHGFCALCKVVQYPLATRIESAGFGAKRLTAIRRQRFLRVGYNVKMRQRLFSR
jgi:hypothetical protein